VPWVYVRDCLARRYSRPPYEIDCWPWNEVETALRIMALEAEGEAFQQAHQQR
jgi:hypothetical protein